MTTMSKSKKQQTPPQTPYDYDQHDPPASSGRSLRRVQSTSEQRATAPIGTMGRTLTPEQEQGYTRRAWEKRPQTIYVSAYMAQWKHLVQALYGKWIADGRPEASGGFYREALHRFQACVHPHESLLEEHGIWQWREQDEFEYTHNPIELQSMSVSFTPLVWRQIVAELLSIASTCADYTYDYPAIIRQIALRSAATLADLTAAEERHMGIDDEGNPTCERFLLDVTLMRPFYTRDEVVAMYHLPRKLSLFSRIGDMLPVPAPLY